MVIVQLLGGMGNQMFQYALGRSLSILNKTELRVDSSILMDHHPGQHLVNRSFDLDVFELEVTEASKWEVWKYNRHGLGIPGKAGATLFSMVAGNKTIQEKHFHFDEAILQMKGDLYLAGLWQSYKYFQPVEDTIRRDFTVRKPMDVSSAPIVSEIGNAESVCINVRRGDFLTSSAGLGFVGIDYYKNASGMLEGRFSDLHYFVFSDDLAWCRQSLGFLKGRVSFVGHEHAGTKFGQYFELMRLCKHFIIPNSTFAWWAAWLSEYRDKTVIAPTRWFAHDRINTYDLIPDGWTRT